MGAYVSIPDCAAHYHVTLDCQPWTNSTSSGQPLQFVPDPDIAGIGIVIAFVFVTGVALLLSCASIIWWLSKYVLRWKSLRPNETLEEKEQRRRHHWSFTAFVETIVISCSDQQVFTGAAYAIALRYMKGCKISAYHYNIVANMMLLTCATHLAAATVVQNYWAIPLVACLRAVVTVGVYFATGLLLSNQGATEGHFPTEVPPSLSLNGNTTSLLILPAACFQSDAQHLADTFAASFKGTDALGDALVRSAPGGTRIHGWNHFLVMMLFFALTMLVEFGRFVRGTKFGDRLRKMTLPTLVDKGLHILFGVYSMGGLAIAVWTVVDSAIFIFHLRKWMYDTAKWQGFASDPNPEGDPWSFGQLVPIFLIGLTLLSFLQLASERLASRKKKRQHYTGIEAGIPATDDPVKPDDADAVKPESVEPSSESDDKSKRLVEVTEIELSGPVTPMIPSHGTGDKSKRLVDAMEIEVAGPVTPMTPAPAYETEDRSKCLGEVIETEISSPRSG